MKGAYKLISSPSYNPSQEGDSGPQIPSFPCFTQGLKHDGQTGPGLIHRGRS